jgi:hypothetical protein
MDGRADAVVLFGATGDLVRKKLLPALYQLARADRLGVPVIGVARSAWDDERLRVHARKAVEESRARSTRPPPASWRQPVDARRRLRRRGDVRAAGQPAGGRAAAGVLPGDPAVGVP